MKAASMALTQYPMINAHADVANGTVTHKAAHNISVAMDTPRGLLVPSVKHCEQRSVFEIAEELQRLQALGKENRLGADDLSGGTFSLSNIGAIGGTYAAPVLVVPQVCIGALGRTRVLPRFNEEGEVVPSRVMNVSWSADHRVLDGATVARFSNEWKRLFSSPGAMLSDLR